MSTSASSSEESRPALYPRAGSQSAGLTASPSFPDLEQAVLEYWQGDDTFRASVENRPAGEDGSNEFVFYDGPPFANGLPHYGHLLTGYAKDVVPRYQTMRGRRVERRFGWDTHGLPAELEAERQLGITDKSQITETGIEEFNAVCRSSVLRYTDEWQDYVTRQGRWVDFENDYKTLNPSFMESVIWAFKQLYDKGLVYQGYRVLPYCWKDQTPLSNHELRMDDDVYKSRQDPSVTVGYRLESGEYVLIWTTTPWTVPSNQAVAVHPEVDYVAVRPTTGPLAGEVAILAEARVAAYAAELGEDPEVVARYRGEELLGRRYEPPFGYFAGRQDEFGEAMHTVLAAEFVSTEDGTGIVHQAPAFGEEDKELTDTYGIQAVRPVDDAGCFDSRVPDYEGQQVFEANKAIIRDLKDHSGPMAGRAAVLLRHDTYEHSYPHCWRCRTPLIYRAVESWFVQVTAFKDRMVELNEEITWVPGNVKHGQFGTWLSNARDWSISRNRYWGSPIPVWMSDDPSHPRIDVYGSFAELEADFGRLPLGADGQPDLHRPFIDDLTRPNPDDPTGKSTMRRVPDVLDVWFDSGSMSFAQVHYPFEAEDWFEHHFPGDFIVEYIGQTRGWFYTLHVLATALFDRPAFRSCVSHGIVLGSDGQKMSKSLRNYPDVSEVFDRDGSDAMRWFLMSSPILRGGNLVVTEQGIRDGVRQVLLPLWNAWHFYATYANAEGHEGRRVTEATGLLDRYALAATSRFVADVTAAMDVYDISGACELVRSHVDMLTNWYIRRSRRRFWAGGAEAAESFDVLFTCLETLARAAAPLIPFALEEIYRGLTGERSVHLADFPTPDEVTADPELVAAMQRTREICSVGSSLRKAAKRRVRQPLSRLVVALEESLHPEMIAIIAEELNVREVDVVSLADAREAGFSLQTRLTVHARAAGPRLGKKVQVAIRGSKTGDWSAEGGRVVAGGIELQEGEFVLEEIADSAAQGYDLAVLSGSGFIALDTRVTPELEAEGLARDTIRAVQAVRKELDLAVSDRIRTRIVAPAEVREAIAAHEALIAAETLSLDLATAEELAEAVSGGTVGEGTEIRILVERA